MRKVPLHEAKDDLSRYLRDPEKEEIVITRHGKRNAQSTVEFVRRLQ